MSTSGLHLEALNCTFPGVSERRTGKNPAVRSLDIVAFLFIAPIDEEETLS